MFARLFSGAAIVALWVGSALAEIKPEAKEIVEQYRAGANAKLSAAIRQANSSKSSREQRAAAAQRIKFLEGVLAELDKGKVPAQTFGTMAAQLAAEAGRANGIVDYTPKKGQLFRVAPEDMLMVIGERVTLRWTPTILDQQNNGFNRSSANILVEAIFDGDFKTGHAYYVSSVSADGTPTLLQVD